MFWSLFKLLELSAKAGSSLFRPSCLICRKPAKYGLGAGRNFCSVKCAKVGGYKIFARERRWIAINGIPKSSANKNRKQNTSSGIDPFSFHTNVQNKYNDLEYTQFDIHDSANTIDNNETIEPNQLDVTSSYQADNNVICPFCRSMINSRTNGIQTFKYCDSCGKPLFLTKTGIIESEALKCIGDIHMIESLKKVFTKKGFILKKSIISAIDKNLKNIIMQYWQRGNQKLVIMVIRGDLKLLSKIKELAIKNLSSYGVSKAIIIYPGIIPLEILRRECNKNFFLVDQFQLYYFFKLHKISLIC